MSTLPADVLLLIFSQLVQRDQFECITVCKAWYKVIRHHLLFCDIHIDSQKHLDALIRQVIRDLSLGARVQRLTLNFELETGFDELMLIDLFPNVREFRLINQNKDKPSKAVNETHPRHPWRDRIEKLVDTMPFNNTNTLLKSGICKNLTHLSMCGNKHPRAYKLFKQLRMAPALTTLYLKEYSILFQDFELLHSVVPSIRSILLNKCYFNCDSFPHNIKSATSVKSFRVLDAEYDSLGEEYLYVRYLAEKYSHLEELAFDLSAFEAWEETELEEAIRHRATVKAYLTKLGKGLKRLSITSTDTDDDILPHFDVKTLDDCGCQIQKLELGNKIYLSTLERLSMTEQAKHIRSLTVDSMEYNPGSTDDIISLQWLERFTKLKELSLVFPCRFDAVTTIKHRLNLPDLFDPLTKTQVDTIQIKHAKLHVEMGNSSRSYPAIKDLYIYEVEFHWDADILLAKALPNVKRLTLDSCLKDRRLFAFPNMELSYFQIAVLQHQGPLHVLVITVDDSQQRLYTLTKKAAVIGFDRRVEIQDKFSLPAISSVPYTSASDSPFVTIICKSITEVFMWKYTFDDIW